MSNSKKVRFKRSVADCILEDNEGGEILTDDAAVGLSRKRFREQNDDEDYLYDSGDVKSDMLEKGESLGKHTLDSDEEDEVKYVRLNMEEVEGQEDPTLDFDEEIKITPFNMKEEEEEGHFDSEGNFIFNKTGNELKDAWLDNIDWARVKHDAGNKWQHIDDDDSSDLPTMSKNDKLEIYRQILQLLAPGETITKALKRLGGSKTAISARQHKWKKNSCRIGTNGNEIDPNGKNNQSQTEVDLGDPDKLNKLTELVDHLVSEGEFEAYGYTYEKLNYDMDRAELGSTARKDPSSENDEDDELNMFADLIDERKQTSATKKDAIPESSLVELPSDEVKWIYKSENNDLSEIFGPFSSSQMLEFSEEGKFGNIGVWVRRLDQSQDSAFYSSKRIDFDLYI